MPPAGLCSAHRPGDNCKSESRMGPVSVGPSCDHACLSGSAWRGVPVIAAIFRRSPAVYLPLSLCICSLFSTCALLVPYLSLLELLRSLANPGTSWFGRGTLHAVYRRHVWELRVCFRFVGKSHLCCSSRHCSSTLYLPARVALTSGHQVAMFQTLQPMRKAPQNHHVTRIPSHG